MTMRNNYGGSAPTDTAAHINTTDIQISKPIVTSTTLPVVAGVEIPQDKQGRLNLNVLHRASMQATHKAPNRWLSTDTTKELIEEIRQTPIEEFGVFVEPVEVTRGGTTPGTYVHRLLAISYAGWISPKFQLKVNQAFIYQHVGSAKSAVPQSLPEALRMAAELAEQNETLRVSHSALHRIAGSDGSLTLTNAAKNLQVKRNYLTTWLAGNGWIYKRISRGCWIAYQKRLDQDVLVHKVNEIVRPNGTTKLVEQVLVTSKGLAKLTKAIELGARNGN